MSPLRALISDQVKNARPLVPSAALTSDTPEALRQRLYAQLEGATRLELKCLFVAPELLDTNKRVVRALARLAQRGQLSLVAVDEAHCVVDWGAPRRLLRRSLLHTCAPRPSRLTRCASGAV